MKGIPWGTTLPVTVHPMHCPNPRSPLASLHLGFCGYNGNIRTHAVVEKRQPPLTQMAEVEKAPLFHHQLRILHSATISADLGTAWCVDPIHILDGSETLAIKLLSGYSCSISVQFSHSATFDSLRPHGLQHARPPCPSPTPGVYSNPCPLNQ